MAMNSEQSRLVARIRRFVPEVNRVADPMRPFTFTVTNRDIGKSSKKDPENCAVACAIKRMGWDAAIIQRCTAYLVRGDLAVRYYVPHSVSRELTSFDRNGDFRPGEYGLSRVRPSYRLGAHKSPGPRGRGGDHKAHKKPLAVLRSHKTEGIR